MTNTITCAACGGQVSPLAKSCPNCGNPIVKGESVKPLSKAEDVGNGLGGASLGMAIAMIIFFFLFWPLAIVFAVLGLGFSIVGLAIGRKKGAAAVGLFLTLVPGLFATVGLVAGVFGGKDNEVPTAPRSSSAPPLAEQGGLVHRVGSEMGFAGRKYTFLLHRVIANVDPAAFVSLDWDLAVLVADDQADDTALVDALVAYHQNTAGLPRMWTDGRPVKVGLIEVETWERLPGGKGYRLRMYGGTDIYGKRYTGHATGRDAQEVDSDWALERAVRMKSGSEPTPGMPIIYSDVPDDWKAKEEKPTKKPMKRRWGGKKADNPPIEVNDDPLKAYLEN